MSFVIALFRLAHLIHVVIYLLIVYGYFKQNSHDGSLPNSTGPLPEICHGPSHAQTAESKFSTIKNPHDMHIHNSLSNVAIHTLC